MHDFFNAVIVIAIVLAVVYLRRIRHRGGGTRGGAHSGPSGYLSMTAGRTIGDGASSREIELEHEIAELRKRLAVLERIVTDDRHGRDIAAQIEALRD